MTDRDPDFGHDCGPDCTCFGVTGEEDVEMAPRLDGAIEPNALAPKGSSSAATPSPAREVYERLREEWDALGLLSFTGDGSGGWRADLNQDDIKQIRALLLDAAATVEALQRKVSDDRTERWSMQRHLDHAKARLEAMEHEEGATS